MSIIKIGWARGPKSKDQVEKANRYRVLFSWTIKDKEKKIHSAFCPLLPHLLSVFTKEHARSILIVSTYGCDDRWKLLNYNTRVFLVAKIFSEPSIISMQIFRGNKKHTFNVFVWTKENAASQKHLLELRCFTGSRYYYARLFLDTCMGLHFCI